MGIGVVLHGYITYPALALRDTWEHVYRHNRRVLRGLPRSDDDWPFMPRSMFSIPPIRRTRELQVPHYETGLIHFAGEYKDMHLLEANWVRKFEDRLLSRLCWDDAVVTVENPGLRYEWRIEIPDLKQYWEQSLCDPPTPPTRWMFRCREVNEEPTDLADAIDGELASPHHVPWRELWE